MVKWGLLFLAGGVGTLSRYLVSGACCQLLGTRFAYGTLAVNLAGCFLIGFFASIAEAKGVLSDNARLFIIIGFLGAFTTFSNFVFETAGLIKNGQAFLAFANIALSLILGFTVFYLGVMLGK